LYPERNRIVRECFDKLESSFKQALPDVISRARHRQSGEIDSQVLDDFSVACVETVVKATQNLLQKFA
jgi:hypothetical protein